MIATSAPKVFAPVVTPFKKDLSIDTPRFVSFCKWLVSQNAGLAIFGTNSEANSLSLSERSTLLNAVVDAGIDPAVLMPGTGASALPDAVELTRQAVHRGCGGALVLPPFFYKGVSDEGVYSYYAEIVDRVASPDLQLYLYHIPQMSGVPITSALVARLLKAYPKTVVGMKDSSGDWANTERMLKEFPGFKIFPASEALLEKALPLGAAGCVSATANLQPRVIAAYIESWKQPSGKALNEELTAVRTRMQRTSMIPALKEVVAHHAGDRDWATVRPPLSAVPSADTATLLADLVALGFTMPGLKNVH